MLWLFLRDKKSLAHVRVVGQKFNTEIFLQIYYYMRTKCILYYVVRFHIQAPGGMVII